MSRRFLATGALSGLCAVALGAFGSHALRDRIDADLVSTFETAARYQMYHALALLAVGLVAATRPSPDRLLLWSGRLFVAGSILFSGSLYVMAISGWRALGIVTPFGGLALLGGWLLFALAARRPSAVAD